MLRYISSLCFFFCTSCREENCHWCLHVHLPVPDCCTPGREPSAEWGGRDNKVWHSAIQLKGFHAAKPLCSPACSSFSATWWECSTGRSACWRTASNLCMCLTANPRSSNHQRSVRVLWLPVGHFAIVSACKILKKLLRRIKFGPMFTLCIALVCLQLEKRGERRAEAEKQLAKAQEAGESLCSSHSIQQSFWIRTLWIQSLTRDLVISFSYFFAQNKTFPQLSCVCVITGEQENIDKFTKRLVKVTKQHNDECKKLLALMGVPFVEVQTCCPFCTCAPQLESIRSDSWQLAIFFIFFFFFWGPGAVRSWGQLCCPGQIGESLCHRDGRYGWTHIRDQRSAQAPDCQRSKVSAAPSRRRCQLWAFREFPRRRLINSCRKFLVLRSFLNQHCGIAKQIQVSIPD